MTHSIIGRDLETDQLGIAVQSRYFAAKYLVPSVEAGVGVVASQAFANPTHGPEALRILRSGSEPQTILEKLLSEDPGAASRQLAILDTHGKTAVHAGKVCASHGGKPFRWTKSADEILQSVKRFCLHTSNSRH